MGSRAGDELVLCKGLEAVWQLGREAVLRHLGTPTEVDS
jgi:hypothetical protein